LRVHEAFARRLGRDDEQVSAEMTALVARIRGEGRDTATNGKANGYSNSASNGGTNAAANGGAIHQGTTAIGAAFEPAPNVAQAAPRRRRTAAVLAIAAVVIVAAIAARRASRAPEPTVLAVGLIRDHTGSPELAAAVSELLSTDLARAAGSRVISTPRMYELVAQVDSSGGERQRLGRAARAAGADEFIEGALYRDSSGLRLELERVNLPTGRAMSVRSIAGADPFALAERATESILGTMRLARASGRLRDVVAQSPMALRFYQEGMRARAQNDRAAAKRFFAAAVAEDSTFAMATFELAMTEPQVGPLHLRALHLAASTSDRERLMIQATLAHLLDDPASRTFAETLAVRYPDEPEGPLMLGRALIAEGRFTDAITPLRRVVVMDSASLRSTDGCRACDAYAEIVSAYIFMDSVPVAERVAREYLKRQPTRTDARFQLVNALQHQQRYDEARGVVTEIEDASGATRGEYGARAEMLMREGRLNEAEAYLLRIMDATTGDDRANAQWGYAILLRMQGRYREALAVADRLRARDAAPPAPPAQKFWSAGMRANILYDMGRYADAIALRDSVVRVPFGYTTSRQARSTVGELGNIATARAALGDTAALSLIAEQVERMGKLTGYAIHRRMFHYVRGLRLGLLGRHDEAAREIRESIYSPISGFVRESYELGRELVAAGKPREAVEVLGTALRGPVGAGGLSVTRPQLEMQLARAYEASGDTAAAIAGYGRATAAWERGDRYVAQSRAEATRRIRALTR
jgi:tetratricopeptide (TPR) repeat protein